LALPWAQIQLAQALIATGKPVVLVMFEGRPRVIDKIVGGSKAILIAFLPGMDGGEALANILFGDANPSGKLPITYPRYVNALYHYDHTLAEVEGGNT
ncbi:MAG TPA: glycoside hydrolase family 3 C-terminal domain-containing protein, partial [Candidatus Kryptobacter bacterium]|nr:glycoside hydrolase family 3 C-terminal domain-containing protein [Candidatus Kryptobacter bacterium]